MLSEELRARFTREEEKLKRANWAYRVNQAIIDALRPVLTEKLKGFSAYDSAASQCGQDKNTAAYETGHRVGKAVVEGRVPVFAREDIQLSDVLGSIPPSEALRSAWSILLDQLSRDQAKFLELYDTAILGVQGLQELYASFWGFQAAGVNKDWAQWFKNTIFPEEDEAPEWF